MYIEDQFSISFEDVIKVLEEHYGGKFEGYWLTHEKKNKKKRPVLLAFLFRKPKGVI